MSAFQRLVACLTNQPCQREPDNELAVEKKCMGSVLSLRALEPVPSWMSGTLNNVGQSSSR